MADPPTPFASLADPTRRAILRLLRAGSRPAGEIAAEFQLSKPTISHHLKVLEQSGLLRSERRGTSIVYTLQANAIQELATELLDLVAHVSTRARKKAHAK